MPKTSRPLPQAVAAPHAVRFWRNVKIGGPDECWPWKRKPHQGYGDVKIGATVHKAHRVADALVNGDIPANVFTLHKCDFKLCCNPKHHFRGTQDDNMKDMARKGRAFHQRGEDNGKAKLTAEIVLKIFREPGMPSQVARRFNVNPDTVRHIRTGRQWSTVTGLPRAST